MVTDSGRLPSLDACRKAFAERDPRFDGVLIAGTATTKIYCRPSCPATAAKPENLRFFADPAAARRAGYRACLRCKPDAAGA
jgi:methylphosphotriester-DNA--protein-cysteine methyltransferase